MKGLRSSNKELENRLQEWADFYLRDSNGLGYPSINTLGVLQRDGGILGRGHGAKYPPENLRAQEVEEWVSELAKSNLKFYQVAARVLRKRYLFSSPNVTDEALARKMGIGSLRTYYRYLKTAKTWIEYKIEKKIMNLPSTPRHMKKADIEFLKAANY